MAVTSERWLNASARQVWDLWSTPTQLEAWWPPAGIVVTVEQFDLREGGRIEFAYEEAGSRVNPEWGKELENRGVRTRWRARGNFQIVRPYLELRFRQELDFGSDVRPIPYSFGARLERNRNGTFVSLRAESRPSKHWGLLAKANLEGQLERLARLAEAV